MEKPGSHRKHQLPKISTPQSLFTRISKSKIKKHIESLRHFVGTVDKSRD